MWGPVHVDAVMGQYEKEEMSPDKHTKKSHSCASCAHWSRWPFTSARFHTNVHIYLWINKHTNAGPLERDRLLVYCCWGWETENRNGSLPDKVQLLYETQNVIQWHIRHKINSVWSEVQLDINHVMYACYTVQYFACDNGLSISNVIFTFKEKSVPSPPAPAS